MEASCLEIEAWTAKANKRVQFGYGLNYLIDIEYAKAPAKLARSAGVSPAQVRPSKPPGSECCVRRRRRRTRSVHSGCVGCVIEPRNDEFAGAETVLMVERNMCNAVMRGIAVPPGSKSTSRAKGSRRKLGYLVTGRQCRVRGMVRIGKVRSRSR